MTYSSKTPDVIIVGAGIVGSSLAYFLQRQNVQCVLYERDGVASQASGWAAGELSPLSRVSAPTSFTRFCLEGLRLHWEYYPVLVDETKIDYHLESIPVFRPAFTEQECTEAQSQLDLYKNWDMKAEWLSATEMAQRNSWVSQRALGSVYTESEAQLDPRLLTMALAKGAQMHGAEIRTTEVTGIISAGNKVTGVKTRDGETFAGTIVIAMGPWCVALKAWIGLNIPISPLRGQIVHFDLAGGFPNQAIFHHTGYVLPKSSGLVFAGTTEEEAGFDPHPTKEGIQYIKETAVGLAPQLRTAEIANVTACLRPLCVDGLPIIGPIPGWDSLFVGTGHGRKGILLGVATGKYLSQQILKSTPEYPMDEFLPARFVSQMD